MIRGKYVALRAIGRADLPALLEWRNRPANRRFFREHRELTMTQQEDWYSASVLHDPSVNMFSIIAASDGRLLGACGLNYVNWVDRTADLSLYVGDGNLYIDDEFAPEAARLLIDHGFGTLDLHRIWAEIYDFDDRKRALFEDLGFTLEGRHREHHIEAGKRCDSLFYGLLRGEWGVQTQV